MVTEGAGKAGTGEKLRGIPVIFRGCPCNDLFKVNGELIGVKRSPLSHFFPWRYDLEPRFHGRLPSISCVLHVDCFCVDLPWHY